MSIGFEPLLKRVADILSLKQDRDSKLKAVCVLLREKVSHYDWVGFYFVDSSNENELVLGPFAGEETQHVRIPFGRGVCGRAAEKKKTVVVQDVSKENNYLACSLRVKSEMVVPILKNGRVVGELDIDSHQLSAFKEKDKRFLEEVSKLVANIL